MKKNSIAQLLINLHENIELDKLHDYIELQKKAAVIVNDQDTAKECWIAQTIIRIHAQHRQAFNLIAQKEYYNAWCQLERIEIDLHNLKRHFNTATNNYHLFQIEKILRNLQILFPYKLFGSVELLKKKKLCSVCNQEISIRKPCGHHVGEIYNGEMCHRIVTDAEVLGMAVVEDPGNKFSVMFIKDQSTGEQKDHYNYYPLEYLFSIIEDPYTDWNLEVSELSVKKSDFSCGRNDKCECGSGIKFKKCCLKTVGNTYPHYEFIFPNNIFSESISNIKHKKN
ncbi:YecA family protein [Flavobacterium sp. RNTU_13]|uniref:YecA family protein n=1 Tax=Flavobacterium sp. RNTU_13 TaxID=3375145 RepID=UPI0039878D6A